MTAREIEYFPPFPPDSMRRSIASTGGGGGGGGSGLLPFGSVPREKGFPNIHNISTDWAVLQTSIHGSADPSISPSSIQVPRLLSPLACPPIVSCITSPMFSVPQVNVGQSLVIGQDWKLSTGMIVPAGTQFTPIAPSKPFDLRPPPPPRHSSSSAGASPVTSNIQFKGTGEEPSAIGNLVMATTSQLPPLVDRGSASLMEPSELDFFNDFVNGLEPNDTNEIFDETEQQVMDDFFKSFLNETENLQTKPTDPTMQVKTPPQPLSHSPIQHTFPLPASSFQQFPLFFSEIPPSVQMLQSIPSISVAPDAILGSSQSSYPIRYQSNYPIPIVPNTVKKFSVPQSSLYPGMTAVQFPLPTLPMSMVYPFHKQPQTPQQPPPPQTTRREVPLAPNSAVSTPSSQAEPVPPQLPPPPSIPGTIPTPVLAPRKKRHSSKVQLTEEEKRANHVASEQKRRKNIRLGFRALTQLVPELRVHSDRYLSDKEEGDEEDGQSNVKRRRKSERASHSAPSKSDILASVITYIERMQRRNMKLAQRAQYLMQLAANSKTTPTAFDRQTHTLTTVQPPPLLAHCTEIGPEPSSSSLPQLITQEERK